MLRKGKKKFKPSSRAKISFMLKAGEVESVGTAASALAPEDSDDEEISLSNSLPSEDEEEEVKTIMPPSVADFEDQQDEPVSAAEQKEDVLLITDFAELQKITLELIHIFECQRDSYQELLPGNLLSKELLCSIITSMISQKILAGYLLNRPQVEIHKELQPLIWATAMNLSEHNPRTAWIKFRFDNQQQVEQLMLRLRQPMVCYYLGLVAEVNQKFPPRSAVLQAFIHLSRIAQTPKFHALSEELQNQFWTNCLRLNDAPINVEKLASIDSYFEVFLKECPAPHRSRGPRHSRCSIL